MHDMYLVCIRSAVCMSVSHIKVISVPHSTFIVRFGDFNKLMFLNLMPFIYFFS